MEGSELDGERGACLVGLVDLLGRLRVWGKRSCRRCGWCWERRAGDWFTYYCLDGEKCEGLVLIGQC